MRRRWAPLLVALLVAAAGVVVPGRVAVAAGPGSELWVTLALNAAGSDRIRVEDATFTTDYAAVAAEVGRALDRPAFSVSLADGNASASLRLHDGLARPDAGGGLSYALDTGKLQLLAQAKGYDAVVIEVCTPRVRQVVRSLRAPEPSRGLTPGSRCGGWYQPVEEPPIRAVVQLFPDRDRYPSAVGRSVGAAAIAFGLLGIGATLLRRGPLRRRSLVSWLLAIAAVGVAPVGWAAATLILWWTGAVADPLLLGGGSVGEQVARTLLPGLAFLVPALLPGAVLLSAPRRDRSRPPPPPAPEEGPTWWPAAWWPLWAAQAARPAPFAAPARGAPAPPPPEPPAGAGSDPSGWTLPGAGGG